MITNAVLSTSTHEPGSTAWHSESIEAIEQKLQTAPTGLDDALAHKRLEQVGPNILEDEPPTSSLKLLLHQFKSPLISILLVAAIVTLVLREYIDVAVILAVLILNAVIGFTQERKAESSVRALATMVAPRARVIRNGHENLLESRDLVPGDLVLLESGVRTPADIRLISSTSLQMDESPLTGESLPVLKQVALLPSETVVADRTNMVFKGTMTTSGRGRGYVVATGSKTALGEIASHVRAAAQVTTPLEQRMERFARVIGVAVGVSAILAFLIGFIRGEPAGDVFMIAVALAVSAIPEGLPVATTIALAVGVRRMARRSAIVRHLPAVETLGSTTSIGSDKTGTLTENRMTVQRIWTAGRMIDVADALSGIVETDHCLRMTLLAGTLTNEAELEATGAGWKIHGDPTEAALLIAGATCGIDLDAVRTGHEIIAEIPFEPARQYSASLRHFDDRPVLFVKGAPERLLAMSTFMQGPDGPVPLDREQVLKAADELADRGWRVLAMAYADAPPSMTGPATLPEPEGLVLAGLAGMLDPPRLGVREAIAACREAGMRTIMITGDHAFTASAIGRDLGLVRADEGVLTGSDISGYDQDQLREAVRTTSVFARVAPEQKLQIVQALQANGEVVAVTGDGVNDAPALSAADIGVAMGRSGTDVARESADMVLTDDNFVSIVAAVEEGRITFDNIRKVAYFLIGTGAAEVVAIIVSLIAGWPLPFIAAQILWLNLVTNGVQDVALAFEPGEPNILKRKPRARTEGILSRLLWERTAIVAAVMAVGTLGMFHWELNRGGSLIHAQTVALTTMVVFQVFQAGNSRSEVRSIFALSPFSNPMLFAATTVALAIHIGALYLGPTQYVLRVEPIDLEAWIRIVIVASSVLVASELHKLVRRGATS
jgi:Ca2+-transporting ATPase